MNPPKAILSQNKTKGYHGTTFEAADSIIRADFKPSQGSEQYLGSGVYFFDDQPAHACSWAQIQAGNRQKGLKVAVIESDIEYGNLLNLSNTKEMECLRWFKSAFEQKAKSSATLATIIDIVAEQTKADVVKAIRIPKNPRSIGIGFSADVEVILSVRNLKKILSKQLHWSGMIGYV